MAVRGAEKAQEGEVAITQDPTINHMGAAALRRIPLPSAAQTGRPYNECTHCTHCMPTACTVLLCLPVSRVLVQTVVRLLPGEKFDYKKVRRISFVFKCTSADSWCVQCILGVGRVQQTLLKFYILPDTSGREAGCEGEGGNEDTHHTPVCVCACHVRSAGFVS